MSMIFVNFPVADIEKSTEFYTKLGFKKNNDFSDENASSMVWDDNFSIMLLSHDFYSKFIGNKTIADAKTSSSTLISFVLPSIDAVKEFGRIAKENGGNSYRIDMGIPEDQMYGLEVEDIDGNILEPGWFNF